MTNGRASAWTAAAALALGLLTGCAGGGVSGEAASVETVAAIVSGGSVGLADRYAGMVVAGETANVKRDGDKVVLETYVQVGDMVKAGDPLFAYDVEKMQLDLDELYLKKADYENTVASANAEISELENQRGQAKDEDKLSYTLQIDSRRADIREAQYNMAVNDRDIAAMEASLQDTVVDSPIAGRIMSVDETGGSGGDDYYPTGGQEDPAASKGVDYITVTDVDSMRVQGNVNEMNASALTEGMAMTIRSRLDKTETWSGTLTGVDWENPVQNNTSGSMVYISSEDSDEMTTASKYPFYIELDSTEGLMLGQHVYIEPDTGGEDEEKPAGPMLPGYYIVQDEDQPYVWADDGDGKLEKRAVELGVHDEETDAYEILDGLALTDCIAFPEEALAEGQRTEKYDPAAGEDEETGAADAPAGF